MVIKVLVLIDTLITEITLNNNKHISTNKAIAFFTRYFFIIKWRFQLYLISHLDMLILIYQIDVFYRNIF